MMAGEYRIGQHVGFVSVDRPSTPIALPERWYVLRAIPGKERKVMSAYGRRGISAYLPTVRRDVVREIRRFGRVCHRIKVTMVEPLFGGIIFIPDFQARAGGVMVDGVEGYFRMDGCYPCLRPTDYAYVREIERLGNIPVAHKRRMLKRGEPVWVTDGPFATFGGVFDQLDSEGRLKVLVEIFGRLTPVTLDEAQIEPA